MVIQITIVEVVDFVVDIVADIEDIVIDLELGNFDTL